MIKFYDCHYNENWLEEKVNLKKKLLLFENSKIY